MYLVLRNKEKIVIESDREVITIKCNQFGIISSKKRKRYYTKYSVIEKDVKN